MLCRARLSRPAPWFVSLIFAAIICGLPITARAQVGTLDQVLPKKTSEQGQDAERQSDQQTGDLKLGQDKQTDKPLAQPLNDDEYYELFRTLVDVMSQVENNYVQKVDRRELMEAAIQGVLSKLDPYSNYIPPSEIARFRQDIEATFAGVGIQVGERHGMLMVISPIVGSPAYRAGVRAGDLIVEVAGKTAADMSVDQAMDLLQGAPGSEVSFKVLRGDSPDPVEINIKREIIRVDTVIGTHRDNNDQWNFMLDPARQIGYVCITGFSRETPDDLRKALAQLKADGMKGLVLDLRFNPGGLLEAAIDICDQFIARGRIVSTRDRFGKETVHDAHAFGTNTGFPMAVLVNRYSASASEVVSACLQDHARAVIVGERTFGKGSVQDVVALAQGTSALKITVASYHRPSGKNIHRFPDATEEDEWGVVPDEGYKLRMSDIDLIRLAQQRRDRDVVRAHDAPDKEPPLVAPNPGDPPASDRAFQDKQLDKALEYLNSKLQ